MSESPMFESPSSGAGRSAEELRDRVETQAEGQELGAQDFGADEEESDPATAEQPPQGIRAGEEKRRAGEESRPQT
jgi:hypothetical protein